MSTIHTTAPQILTDDLQKDDASFAQDARVPVVLKKQVPLLSHIKHPAQVATLTTEELELLAEELRHKIISTTAKTGGHLAPSLGVVELTLALLSVFNPENDKIIWDVGHQSYAYKLLTGRANVFHTLRQYKGISGFPNRFESPFDHFGVGHASTSLSAALGMADARDLSREKHHVVSVIGDGALAAGIAFEAMNQAGGKKRPFIVILNDNDMSISKNVGALSFFMSRNLSARWVRRVKKEVEGFLKSIPSIGDDLYEIARRSKHSFKNFFTPGILFEALNFNYIGPVNGHDVEELQKVLHLASTLEKPVLVHVLTQKGKGYAPAEKNPILFHGIGQFNTLDGVPIPHTKTNKTFTKVFSEALVDLAKKDERIFAITAAMPEGTGLSDFAELFPERFTDVGICEQHAVTYAAGLATQGYRPFVTIYSTFLQRAYDQIIHDVCLQKLPVTFCIDRAGLVGQDGPTHHGVFDLAYLRHMPNMTLFAPKDEYELRCGLATALAHNGPFALRYPRGNAPTASYNTPIKILPLGTGDFLHTGTSKTMVIALGHSVTPALAAVKELEKTENISCSVFNARFIKPLPQEDLKKIAHEYDKILIVEEHALAGGFSSAILEFWADANLLGSLRIKRLGLPDAFIEHGTIDELQSLLHLDTKGIIKTIKEFVAS